MAIALGTVTAKADISDGHFSTNQIFDVQYYWSGTTLNASNFIAPYDMNFTHPTVTSGQYFAFFPSTTNPGTYGLGLYNSNGTLAQVVHNTGTLQAIGPDALFYIGSGFFGTVITTSAGYSYGSSASFSNMDTSVSTSDMTSYTWASTTPLSAGQTASSTPSTPAPSGPNYVAVTQPTVVSVTPTSTNSPAGETAENAIDGDPSTKYLNFDRANAGFTIKLQSAQVLQGIKFTTANDFPDRDPSKYSLYGSNDGVNWTTIVNAASITLSDNRYTQSSMYTITNTNPYFYYFITFPDIKASASYADINACGLACDSVQIGDVEFIYDTNFAFTAPTDTGTGTIANPGTAGSVSDMAVPVVGPQAVTVASGATGTNASGTTTLAVTNAGTYTNDGINGDVTNSGTFTNNNVTGNVTNTGTFTNNGTTGSVDNSGTFTNNGTTGNVINQPGGTFTNNGTTGTVENGLYTGVFVNNGTTSSIINRGTFTNNVTGDTGAVVNAGTFDNYGETGNVENMGVFTNKVGGAVSGLTYNNHVVRNYGSIGSITYQGGSFTNYAGGTVGSINTTQAHGNWNNQGTVTGTVTTNGNFVNQTTGVVQGLYTNTGTLRNYGTLGAVTNGSTLTNYAGATVGNVTNTGTFTNAGTASNVTNSGTMTTNGTVGSVTNTGTLNYNGGTLGAYTQTAGTTVMSANTPLTVTGNAQLGGGLVVNDAPTAFGRYTLLSAGNVSGEFASISQLAGSDYLVYTPTGVKLYVAPSAQETATSINNLTGSLGNIVNLQTNTVTSGLGNDCSTFGDAGACASVNWSTSKAAAGDLQTAGVTVAKKLNDNWRFGFFTNSPLNNATVGPVKQNAQTAFGGFVAWVKGALNIQASAAQGNGDITVNRNGPEVGTGKMSTDTVAYQLKASYTLPVTETLAVTPYVGIRQSETKLGGYTEQGPAFPVTVNATQKSSTDLLAGVSVSKQLTEKLSGNVSVGVVQKVAGQNAVYAGSTEIANLTTFNNALPNNGKTNASFGAGLSYSVDKTTKVGVNVGLQQKGDNANITSVGVSLTKGF